ncbi:MAG TPA: integrase core domain-containing protein [Gaiellaceae bacterium]|nr:integrase core domain-containing protein [Gaiellaceae bacterium]
MDGAGRSQPHGCGKRLPERCVPSDRRQGPAVHRSLQGDPVIGPRAAAAPAGAKPELERYAERFVGSIKSECLRHIVPLGERHPRAVVRQYVEHYHHERNHQGLANVIPLPLGQTGKGAIRRHERLGGVLGHYRRYAIIELLVGLMFAVDAVLTFEQKGYDGSTAAEMAGAVYLVVRALENAGKEWAPLLETARGTWPEPYRGKSRKPRPSDRGPSDFIP